MLEQKLRKENVSDKQQKKSKSKIKNKIKRIKIKIRTKMIKILIVFPGNGAKFDNAVVDAIKLILLIYNNFSIVKKVVNKIVRVK